MPYEVDATGRLTVVRRLEASPQAVFAAFTDADVAATWMWAGIGSNPRASIDPEVGGRYRMSIDPPDGETGWANGEDAFSGIYIELNPPRRLAYTLHWEADVFYNRDGADVGDEVIIVDLDPDDAGTMVTLQHLGIPNDGVSAGEHGKAAEAMFDMLEESLT